MADQLSPRGIEQLRLPAVTSLQLDTRRPGSTDRLSARTPRVAEFFAGIGLVRLAYEAAGAQVVFANDIEPFKGRVYEEQFGATDLTLGDIRQINGSDVPDIEIATASFPCTDLSLAGNRAGLRGEGSGMFWEFARVLREMDRRRPGAVQIENVPSFANSNGGEDLRGAVRELNRLGYVCDLLVIDARRFVPQSRPRLFLVGVSSEVASGVRWEPHPFRPDWTQQFARENADLRLHAFPLPTPPSDGGSLADIAESLPPDDRRWWGTDRATRFIESLNGLHSQRLASLQASPTTVWATAYRRTREGKARWEIRADSLSGCLRCPRGGSSKQAVVQAGGGNVQVRWMTAREYARLQGVDDSFTFDSVTPTQAMFGFGDAVCVGAVEWLARHAVLPAVVSARGSRGPLPKHCWSNTTAACTICNGEKFTAPLLRALRSRGGGSMGTAIA